MPVCPENSYGLDVGRELGEITCDAYVAARVGFINDATMDRITDSGYQADNKFEGMLKGLKGVNQYLVDALNGADAQTRFAVSFASSMDAKYDLNHMASRAALILIQGRILSMVRQGQLTQEELEQAQQNFYCRATEKVLQQLGSEESLRLRLEGLGNENNRRPQPDPVPEVFQDKDLYHPAIFNQVFLHPDVQRGYHGLERIDDNLQALAGEYDLRGIKATLDGRRLQGGTETPRLASDSPSQKLMSKNRVSIGRRVLKRSMNVFKQLIGANELKAFLGEEGLKVEGHYFTYQLKRNPNVDLVSNAHSPGGGHIPYQLTMLDKKSGLEMADLCVYFKDTPALDQVAAMLMHLQSGEEKAILSKANIFNIRPDFYRVMEGIVTEIPSFDRKAQNFVERRKKGKAITSDQDGPDSLLGRIGMHRDNHPGHQIYNEHIDELTRKLEEHFMERVPLSPMMKGLIQYSQRGEALELLDRLEERREPIRLADFCQSRMGIEWQPPELEQKTLANEVKP